MKQQRRTRHLVGVSLPLADRTFWFGLLWIALCVLLIVFTLGIGILVAWLPILLVGSGHLSDRSGLVGAQRPQALYA